MVTVLSSSTPEVARLARDTPGPSRHHLSVIPFDHHVKSRTEHGTEGETDVSAKSTGI